MCGRLNIVSCDDYLRDGPRIDVAACVVRADPLADADAGAQALASAHADPEMVRAPLPPTSLVTHPLPCTHPSPSPCLCQEMAIFHSVYEGPPGHDGT